MNWTELEKAVRSFQLADTEYRRAKNADEQPRLSKAGTRYALAKWRMFRALPPKARRGAA